MSKENHDEIFTFLAGMVIGAVGGALAGILLAPKSGDEIREDAHAFGRNLLSRVNEEWHNQEGETRKLIEKARYTIENQVDKVKRDRVADRMAKAKAAEESTVGYESN